MSSRNGISSNCFCSLPSGIPEPAASNMASHPFASSPDNLPRPNSLIMLKYAVLVVEVQLLSVHLSTGVPGNASIAYSSNMSLSLRHSDIPSSRASAIATNLQLVNLSVGVYSCQFLGGQYILVGLDEMRACLSPLVSPWWK